MYFFIYIYYFMYFFLSIFIILCIYSCHFKIENIFSLIRNVCQYEKLRFSQKTVFAVRRGVGGRVSELYRLVCK